MKGVFILPEKCAGRQDRSPRAGFLRVLLAGCLVASLPGCTESDARQPIEFERVDSAGVEIVTVPGPMLDTLPVWSIARDPVLSITGEQLEGFPLSRIAGALILPDRKVAIGDRTLDQVVVMSFSGTIVHRFARTGSGPGEVGDVSGLRRRAEDELVVWDEVRGRLVVFDTAGAFQEMVQTPRVRTAQRDLSFPGFLADGSPVIERRALLRRERFEGVRQLDFVVGRYRSDGAFDSALVSIPGKEVMGSVSGRRWSTTAVALKGGPHLAVGGGRAHLGHGDRYEIQTWSARGLERITRIDRARKAVSRSEQAAARDSAAARYQRLPFAPGVVVSPSDVPVSDSFPAFDNLVADARGGVWMQESGELQEGPPSWIIFDCTAEPTARVHTPKGFDIVDVRGDLLLGVWRDEFDVPSVLLYRIERGSPESPAS